MGAAHNETQAPVNKTASGFYFLEDNAQDRELLEATLLSKGAGAVNLPTPGQKLSLRMRWDRPPST